MFFKAAAGFSPAAAEFFLIMIIKMLFLSIEPGKKVGNLPLGHCSSSIILGCYVQNDG